MVLELGSDSDPTFKTYLDTALFTTLFFSFRSGVSGNKLNGNKKWFWRELFRFGRHRRKLNEK